MIGSVRAKSFVIANIFFQTSSSALFTSIPVHIFSRSFITAPVAMVSTRSVTKMQLSRKSDLRASNTEAGSRLATKSKSITKKKKNPTKKEIVKKVSKGKVNVPKYEPKKKELPPLNKGTKEASGKPLSVSKVQEKDKTMSVKVIDKSHEKAEIEVSLNKIVQEYEF